MEASRDLFHLDLHSHEHRVICEALNRLQRDPNAVPAFDGMSGAYKFTDEFPLELRTSESSLLFQTVSLLRMLWGHRLTIVEQSQPRFTEWWISTLEMAPQWPGFRQERWSEEMKLVAADCRTKATLLSEDLDRLSERLQAER